MSYDIHVTRKAHWATERGPKISAEEWTAYVNGRSDLRWEENSRLAPHARMVEMLDGAGEVFTAFWWSEGNIDRKRPQHHDIEQMILIARDLNARVMGDEGETYHDPDRPYDSTPAFYDPLNLTNEWREPPPVAEAIAASAPTVATNEKQPVVRPAAVVQSPIVSVTRAMFGLAWAFGLFGAAFFWMLLSFNEFDKAAIVISICGLLALTCLDLARGLRAQKRWALRGAKVLAYMLLVSVPIGTFVGLYLLKQLAQIAPVRRY